MSLNDEQAREYELCHKNDVENNSMKEFEIKVSDEVKVKVLLVKTSNKFSCLASKCSHYSLPLINGVLNKEHIRCFAHGACFNVNTGDIEDYPGIVCFPPFQVYVNENDQKDYMKASIKELSQLKRMPNQVKPSSRTPSAANLVSLNKINNRILPKCLIIGSGAAGMLCLDTLREHGYSSNITMITREAFLPYDRPKLSKALNANISNIQLREENYFKANSVNFFNNQEVDEIQFDKKQVVCKSGRTFDYDKLVIATGLSSIGMGSKSGSNLKGIFTLRSLEDSTSIVNYFNELKSKLDEGKKLNVITYGGSFIAMYLIYLKLKFIFFKILVYFWFYLKGKQ